jgi:hypothetical protein
MIYYDILKRQELDTALAKAAVGSGEAVVD